MNNKTINNILIALISTLIGILLISIGFISHMLLVDDSEITQKEIDKIHESITNNSSSNDFNDFKVIGEIYDVLKDNYVEPERIDKQQLFNASILGILRSLDDVHTNYIDPESFSFAQSDLQGTFQGIGSTISLKGEYVIIVNPFDGSPAEKAGLKNGDKIISVDGEDAKGWSTEKAALRIRGPQGTKVTLEIQSANSEEIKSIVLIRDNIDVPSITYVNSLDRSENIYDKDGNIVNDIGYIRIKSFTENTPDELKVALKKKESVGVKAFIIDVRSNPGGLLNETLQIADMFLNEGIITIQVDRNKNEDITKASSKTVTDLPIVILQDSLSASGSELFAAALQGNNRAIVIGETSFGKGTVNTVKKLSNGGALYVSTARYLSPTRQIIEKLGVKPDIEAKVSEDDITNRKDTVIIKAVEYLKSIL
tara:strand:+ start:805 stop:2079 length:1275 start_codon:yes stop_codon:yes gene_type:complete